MNLSFRHLWLEVVQGNATQETILLGIYKIFLQSSFTAPNVDRQIIGVRRLFTVDRQANYR